MKLEVLMFMLIYSNDRIISDCIALLFDIEFKYKIALLQEVIDM
jgi:hypothetical protein